MTLKRHFTQHGGARKGDSLDLLRHEAHLMETAFRQWHETRGGGQAGRMAGAANYDNGTIGKVIVEHSALLLGAMRDVCRAMSRGPRSEEAEQFQHMLDQTWPLMDRLDELSRGTAPVSIAANDEFVAAVEQMEGLVSPVVGDDGLPARLERRLGERRHQLRTARYVRRHSPTHPGPGHWYDNVGPLARIHTAYDRSRGFPWAESAPVASPHLAEGYDQEP